MRRDRSRGDDQRTHEFISAFARANQARHEVDETKHMMQLSWRTKYKEANECHFGKRTRRIRTWTSRTRASQEFR